MKNDLSLFKSPIVDMLFINGKNNAFDGSKVINLMQKISYPKIAFVLLVLSLICSFYESFITSVGFDFVQDYNFGLIFLLLSLFLCDKTRIKSTKPVVYLILFILSLFVSGLVASISGLESSMILAGTVLLAQFGLSYIIASTFINKNKFIDSVLIISMPAILMGLYQGFFGADTSKLWVSASENLVDSRAYAFFGSPNILGSLAMIVIVISVVKFIENKKYYYLIYSIISFITLIYTFSRSAWIGLAAGLAVVLIAKNWRIILFSPVALLLFFIPSIRQRIFVALSPEYMVDSALDGRIWANNNALYIWQNNPIIGTGPGSYGGQTAIYNNSPIYLEGMQNGYVALPYTDNQWLQILVQTGFVGILFVGLFFVSQLVNNFIQFKKNGNMLSIGIIAVSVAVIINGFFANIWEFSAIAILSGSYMGLGDNYEK